MDAINSPHRNVRFRRPTPRPTLPTTFMRSLFETPSPVVQLRHPQLTRRVYCAASTYLVGCCTDNNDQNVEMDEEIMTMFMMNAAAIAAAMTATAFVTIRKNPKKKRHGGSRPGRAPNRPLGRFLAGKQLEDDHFLDGNVVNDTTGGLGQTWSEKSFERRFRMLRVVYERVRAAIVIAEPFFREGRDATGLPSATTNLKLVSAIWQLSYGQGADEVSGRVRLSESLTHERRRKFVKAVVQCFGDEYLRRPTVGDAKKIMARHARVGFPGALGSVDFSGWELAKGAVGAQRQNIGKTKRPELRLETVCDDRLWIWSLQFGFPGSMNDINVMNCSKLFRDVRAGRWPLFYPSFEVAGRPIDWFYWVADGIYPDFRIFLKTIAKPLDRRERLFAKSQEAFRKGAERVYAVLFSRWHILANPSRIWHTADMNLIVKSCVILHNMIVEARDKDDEDGFGTKNIASIDDNASIVPIRTRSIPSTPYAHAAYLRNTADRVEDNRDHALLQKAMADAMWLRHGTGSAPVQVEIALSSNEGGGDSDIDDEDERDET